MAKKGNKKVVKFHKSSYVNIGVIVFLIILIYMLYNIYQYFTTQQTAIYEVTQGTITQNNTYTGVILREEKVFHVESSGYINYYNRDATKVGVRSYIYSIDETGDFYKKITQQNDGVLFSEKGSYDELEKTASNYVLNYSNKNFFQVYDFQYDMEAELMEAISANALSNIDDYSGTSSGFHAYMASEPGIVVYHTDGLEDVTVDNFSKDTFNMSAHGKNNLTAREQVTTGDPAYKLITNEIWTLVVPIEKSLAADLSKESNIKVEFKKDNSTAWGASRILNRDNAWYLTLKFQNSAIRYAEDRYLEIKLLLSDTSGLKIPNTSLTEKDFFIIPKEFYTTDENGSNGVIWEYKDKNGETVTEFVPVSSMELEKIVVQEETEEEAEEKEEKREEDEILYISGSNLKKGDILIKEDSNEQYTLRETQSFQGVFNVNKGYATFRRVEIIFQNKEYTIIDTGTSYGISLYDHIALDSSTIKENEIVR